MIGARHGVVLAATAIALAACGGTSGSSAPVGSSGSSSAADVTVTLTPSGSATSAQLSSAADIVRARLAAQGITVNTSVSSGAVTVSVPASARGAVAAAAHPGVLSFRELYPLADDMTSASPVASPSAEGEAAPVTVTGLGAPSREPDQTTPSAATLAQFASLDCMKNGGRPTAIDEDTHHFVVACDRNGQTKYLLTPADFVGAQVSSADATMGTAPTGQATGLWRST